MTQTSVYLHIPFCRHRCAYCDFNTYAGLENLIPDYVRALCREIEFLGEAAEERLPVHTAYFGGGTPSLLSIADLERILLTLRAKFDLQPGLELTLEANPGTVTLAYLRDLRALGFNRLSLGMQSANPEELRLLERQHDFHAVVEAVRWARRAGLENLNLDLIFGLPDQSLESWKRSLSLAVNLQPEHFSLYALTVEAGTPLQRWAARGLINEPDADAAADMYEYAAGKLAEAGYLQYEISNWARGEIEHTSDICQPRFACRHNLQYWRNLSYVGLGAGAHGYAGGMRIANILSPQAYIQRMIADAAPILCFPRTPAAAQATAIDRQAEIAETMMMGLRLTQEGISRRTFFARFSLRLEEYFGKEIGGLMRKGLLEWAGEGGEVLRLTPRGRLLGNQVFVEFV